DSCGAMRERVFRARARSIYGRGDAANGTFRTGARRDYFSGRSGGGGTGAAAKAGGGAGGGGGRTRGEVTVRARRGPRAGGDEPRLIGGSGGREISRGLVLSAARVSDRGAAAARPRKRCGAAGAEFPGTQLPADGQASDGPDRG